MQLGRHHYGAAWGRVLELEHGRKHTECATGLQMLVRKFFAECGGKNKRSVYCGGRPFRKQLTIWHAKEQYACAICFEYPSDFRCSMELTGNRALGDS